MTIAVGGGSAAYPFPQMPRPLNGEGFLHSDANIIPHNGTLIDNVELPTSFALSSSGEIRGWLGETMIWSVVATDWDATCDGFIGQQAIWYDHLNDRVYVWALDSGIGRFFGGYVTLETGAVTLLAAFTPASVPTNATISGAVGISRAVVSSGDFVLWFLDRKMTINDSGGLLSDVTAANTSETRRIGSYVTFDTPLVHLNIFQYDDAGNNFVELTVGANSVRVPIPLPLTANATNPAFFTNVVPWGDKVKLLGGNSFTSDTSILRTFDRAQFDFWVHSIARFGGLVA